ncbi:uncharacterized protein LOC132065360 isoform X2 [Lycium ferocissimum]|uniref:uncharacterized protein LOC132065360 isoform X2 n=1 Tax=Lycium ferocissimum TaxID=112874 RepID=UPI002815AFD1|nr:uncharacterized protein LOC132065360 isoform X2 [Lycium ferocissimum]
MKKEPLCCFLCKGLIFCVWVFWVVANEKRDLHTNSRYCLLFLTGIHRLYKVSIATEKKVIVVIMFDRAAKVLFGCSADEFFDFAKTHPFAAANVGKALEGEMLKVTLSQPKNGNARHLRVASVLPLKTGYQPVIETLRELYRARGE